MKPKPQVGQVLYALNVGNAARDRHQELNEVTVSSVGRKYFTCKHNSGWFCRQFHIDDWTEKSEYTPDVKLYESPQEWEDEKEFKSIHNMLRETFTWLRINLSLDQLRRIKAIIDEVSL